MPIRDKVSDVLQRPKFGLSPDQALALIAELHDLCDIVTPIRGVRVITHDPDDTVILACALSADADVIASGDSHLLDRGRWRKVRTRPPAFLLREIEGQSIAVQD